MECSVWLVMAIGESNTVLDQIVSARRRSLEQIRRDVPLERLRRAAETRRDLRDFTAAIRRPSAGGATVRVIAEFKRASPSRGVISEQFEPGKIATAYASSGAAALSVLTEEEYFRGSLGHLAEARQAVQIPVLRKDFILEPYQVYESVAAGADALLLIVAALSPSELCALLALCKELRIHALVEVHTHPELDIALESGARILGINNRNLKTLEVDLATSFELRSEIPEDCITVSESGIKTAADLRRLAQAGFDAVLIGEHLMSQPDPGRALQELLSNQPHVSAEGE